jgi:hypothetical protein
MSLTITHPDPRASPKRVHRGLEMSLSITDIDYITTSKAHNVINHRAADTIKRRIFTPTTSSIIQRVISSH